MAGLSPKTEQITGADCSGISGDPNRTYTLTNSNYDSVITFLRNSGGTNTALIENTDFNIVNGLVTFLIGIDDGDILVLQYFVADVSTSIVSGYGYCSTADVYRTSGLTSTNISTSDISNHITASEVSVCRLTKNIYWNTVLNNQSVNSATNDTITISGGTWTTNEFVNLYVWVYYGVGSVQLRQIISNTADTITVDRDWETNPDNTAKFKIFYVPNDFNPYKTDLLDGNNQVHYFLPYYPVKVVEYLAIGASPVVVDPTNLYLWEKQGKIQLKQAAGVGTFVRNYPLEVDIHYWYGVDYLPTEVKRLVELNAAIKSLEEYMITVAEKPSNIAFPELTITNPQAYTVAKDTIDRLQKEYDNLVSTVKIWSVFG